jgi:hypothetical protein
MSKKAYNHAQQPVYSKRTFEIMVDAMSGLHKGPRGIPLYTEAKDLHTFCNMIQHQGRIKM